MSCSTDSLSSSSSISENSSDSSAGPQTPLRAASPQLKLSDMGPLTLHSPNTQIVGTPFATHCGSAPFEYPFPASPPSATQSLPACSSRPPSPAAVLVPLPPPVFAPSAILSDPTTTLALSLSMGVPTSSSSSSSASASPTTSDVAATTLHHPFKMRMATAPVPPGLIKRRRREKADGATTTGDAGLPTSGRQRSGSSCGTTVMPDTGLRQSES